MYSKGCHKRIFENLIKCSSKTTKTIISIKNDNLPQISYKCRCHQQQR